MHECDRTKYEPFIGTVYCAVQGVSVHEILKCYQYFFCDIVVVFIMLCKVIFAFGYNPTV